MSSHGSTTAHSAAPSATSKQQQQQQQQQALNVYRKVAVIRKPTDRLVYLDDQGATKTVAAQELGDAIAHATPVSQPKLKLDIPVPRINTVESYLQQVTADYTLPSAYVRYHRWTDGAYRAQLEYVADVEDEAWLRSKEPKFGTGLLTIEILERILDALETETAFDVIVTVGQADHLLRHKVPELYTMFAGRHVAVKHVLNDVYAYWVQKRSKLKRPLLRRFWPVTSTDDTNPHLVFRPREKEKYKLRKKRQNDMDAYNKMKQLRSDFDNLKAVLQLVKKREELNRLHLQLQVELFEQRLHDAIDTTGQPRPSNLTRSTVKEGLQVPSFFDVHGRRAKRPRVGSTTPITMPVSTSTTALPAAPEGGPRNVAGHNHGTPAPHFLQPLYSRETYTTSWADAVPYVETYVDAHAQPTFRYRHRPRVGRGGRVVLDRVPVEHDPERHGQRPLTVFTAGKGLRPHRGQAARLLDLLPRPLDHLSLRRRVEEICIAGIQQDYQVRMLPPANGGDPEDNDADEVVVRTSDWNDTDGQLWGEERYVVGAWDD